VGHCNYFNLPTREPENKIERKPRKDYMPRVSVSSWPGLWRANGQVDYMVQLLNESARRHGTAVRIPFQCLKNLGFGFCV